MPLSNGWIIINIVPDRRGTSAAPPHAAFYLKVPIMINTRSNIIIPDARRRRRPARYAMQRARKQVTVARIADTAALLKKSLFINAVLSIAVLVLGVTLIYVTLTYQNYLSTQASLGQAQQHIQNATQKLAPAAEQPLFSGIDQQFNGTALAAINNEPLTYYEAAGSMLLNGTLNDQVVTAPSPQYNALTVDGKPSVIYIGALSCIFCGENRWSMALALGTFGNFSRLYTGYSSLNDAHVPTIYFTAANYTTPAGVAYGNFYNSRYINFFSGDYESPVKTGGFQFAQDGVAYFVKNAPNSTYLAAMSFMNATNKFQGTPFTFWGTSLVGGADAVVFGNTTPSSASSLPLSNMTHGQVLGQISTFSDQFAWAEYAGADVYIAQVCPTISSAAPVCSLPAIKALESRLGV